MKVEHKEEKKSVPLNTCLAQYLDQDTSSIVLQYLLYIPKHTTVNITFESPSVSENRRSQVQLDCLKERHQSNCRQSCFPALQDSLQAFYSISKTSTTKLLSVVSGTLRYTSNNVFGVTLRFHHEAIHFLSVMESLLARLSESQPVTCQVMLGRFTYTIKPSVVHSAIPVFDTSGCIDKPPAVLLNWFLRLLGTEYQRIIPIEFFDLNVFSKMSLKNRERRASDILSCMTISEEKHVNTEYLFAAFVSTKRKMETLYQALKKHYPLQVLCESGFTRIMDMYGIV